MGSMRRGGEGYAHLMKQEKRSLPRAFLGMTRMVYMNFSGRHSHVLSK